MPHKDRATRLAYHKRYNAVARPAPKPEPQSDDALPARGRVVMSADGQRVQCHSCGHWYKSLNSHLKTHGLDGDSYKALYDIARTASLWPPALQGKQRAAAIERDQGSIGRANIPIGRPGRPKGLEQRLSVKIDASESRQGVYTRGGGKTRK